jgi:hypothetical protein
MLKQTVRSLRRRVGPVGLSLVAAALTAVAFAAVSVAKDDSGSGQKGAPGAPQAAPGGPPLGFELNLSDEDKQKLEDFRQCMSDQGVEPPPAPPKPGEDRTFKRRLKPPSEEERQKMDDAFEACKDKLPEGAQGMGPGGPCGPPPGPPPGQQQGTAPGQQGSGSNQDQGYAVPAPSGATS